MSLRGFLTAFLFAGLLFAAGGRHLVADQRGGEEERIERNAVTKGGITATIYMTVAGRMTAGSRWTLVCTDPTNSLTLPRLRSESVQNSVLIFPRGYVCLAEPFATSVGLDNKLR